jgi:hypothetical protein
VTYGSTQSRDVLVFFLGLWNEFDELVDETDEGENVFGGLVTVELVEQEALENVSVWQATMNERNTHDGAYPDAHGAGGDIDRDRGVAGEAAERVDEEPGAGVIEGGPEAGSDRHDVEVGIDVGGRGGWSFHLGGRHGRKEQESFGGRKVQRSI